MNKSIEELRIDLENLIISKGQTMENYEKLLYYYQISLGWSEKKAIEYIIELFDKGVIDKIIVLGKGDK